MSKDLNKVFKIFNLTMSEYSLFQPCKRTKENPFGLRNDQISLRQRKILKRMTEKDSPYIDYNTQTESYELSWIGESAMRILSHLIEGIRQGQTLDRTGVQLQRPVIPFPAS